MNRRSMMMMTGFAAVAAAVPVPQALADASRGGRVEPPLAPPNSSGTSYVFADDFDGPAGSAPDPAKWIVQNYDEDVTPPIQGHYRNDRRNVFVDGNSNLVIRATQEFDQYYSGKVSANWRGLIGHTWEIRMKLDCLSPGCWPAFWLLNADPLPDGEIDVVEWYGNGEWPAGTTVHARSDGHTWEGISIPELVDSNWHTWRVRWDDDGFKFWRDYVDDAKPYFAWPAKPIRGPGGIMVWPFNNPGYWLTPIINLAVGGPGAGDPAAGTFPQQILVDWLRVW